MVNQSDFITSVSFTLDGKNFSHTLMNCPLLMDTPSFNGFTSAPSMVSLTVSLVLFFPPLSWLFPGGGTSFPLAG